MIAFLFLAFQVANPNNQNCTYVDVHNFTQHCAVQKQCPQGQHMHTKDHVYPVYDKDHKVKPMMVTGDGKCYLDPSDKLAGTLR